MSSGERVVTIDIEREMRRSYLAYSMSVIISRAIPDARDGLKPVQRRILTAMNDLNLRPSRPYRKSAKIVGDVTGNYHPHGTSAVYETMVRMAQDFSLRFPLVDGQGNFGSIDGDSAAAERYTEARMTALANEMLRDLDKETVDLVPNYDESRLMPSVLPAVAPNLLMNGTTGIAVGMATNIPPHNLGELVDGMIALMEKPDISVHEMMQHVQGPDFPTAAIIHGTSGIRQAYTTGRGRILVRGRTDIEFDDKRKRERIVITEIPYQVNKATLIEKIADLVRSGRVEGIADIRDESDRQGMRIVIDLKKDVPSQVLLNQLYKMTALQQAFNANMLALINNEPQQCGLIQLMQVYLDHREQVILRRTKFDLNKAKERAHIVQGLLIGVENIDEMIQIIKTSSDTEQAKIRMMERFTLSELQAHAILEMRLARLTGLEREKLEAELEELQETIKHLQAIIDDRQLVLNIIREDLELLRDKFSNPRRTEIAPGLDDFEDEDMIAVEDMVITISHEGYIKRTPLDQYRSQRRGGRGVKGMESREEDFVEHVIVASTHDAMLVFTNVGRVYQLKIWRIPLGSRTSRGKALVNLLGLRPEEKPRDFVPVEDFRKPNAYVVLATAEGVVKRTPLSDFMTRRHDGIIAQGMREGDSLIRAALVGEDEEIILAKAGGRCLRFRCSQLRPMGRTARGVKGITLRAPNDRVVDMVVLKGQESLLTITERGFGKRTLQDDYPVKGRGGLGVIDIKTTDRNGSTVCLLGVNTDDELILITRGGVMIRQSVSGISLMGRNTQGVKIVALDAGDQVVSVAPIPNDGENGNDGESNPDDYPAAEVTAKTNITVDGETDIEAIVERAMEPDPPDPIDDTVDSTIDGEDEVEAENEDPEE
ncbi:MAG: DNA gyrase subunit A [bacterium]|nr:DNA gyrase subunit A [bacterium]